MKTLFISCCIVLAGSSLVFAQQTAPARNPAEPASPPAQRIQMNFRGASLDTVLDYLSQTLGLVIFKETNVDGQIDVWSHQPLTQEEAINLLNTVLHEKGYTAVRNDRILTIVQRDAALQKNLPVKTGNDPAQIPKTDEMVTQIISVRYVNASQLIENLRPLLPEYANLSANESSNAIVLTDTQANIRRIAEIIRALDTAVSSISTVRVFPLQYTDAKELASLIQQLFVVEETTTNNRGGRGGMPMFRGFRGPGGEGGETTEGDSAARKAASRVVAVGDEYSNSLIVTAPDELLPSIEMVVREIDQSQEDITEVRVFPLTYCDATEMTDIITELFPDESTTTTTNFAPRFGGGPGGMFGGGRGGNTNTNSQQSDRKLKQTSVRCVADPRTNSVVVTASTETMVQIEQMIEKLDSDPSKKQKVFVYQLQYADVDNVAEILQGIFESQYGSSGYSTSQNTQNTNTLGNRSVDSGNTGFGSGSMRGN
jgi:general secretion pathway protein D